MVVTLKSDRVESVVQRIEGAHLTLCTPKSDVLDPLRRHLVAPSEVTEPTP